MKPGLRKTIQDFIITVILFQPGVVPRLAPDYSRVTFAGLDNINLGLVADLAAEMGFKTTGIVADQFYLGVQFFEPEAQPAQRGKQFNNFEFSYN